MMRKPGIALAGFIAAGMASTAAATGQELRGLLTDRTSRQPVAYAAVYLLKDGRVAARRLADVNGAFAVPVEAGSIYRLQIEQLGYEPFVSDTIRIETPDVRTMRFEIDTRPVTLPPLTIETGSRGCSISEGGTAVQTIWNEARKALVASQMVVEQRLLQYAGTRYTRRLRPDGLRVSSQQTTPLRGWSSQPFRSIAARELAAHGYVRKPEGSSEYIVHAPDATVLLSTEFLDDHCFSLVQNRAGAQEIGLRFQPVQRRASGRVDIAGTFWLNASNFRLQRLEFQYVGTIDRQAFTDAHGLVEFTTSPDGAWIVRRWSLQVPIMEEYRVTQGGLYTNRSRIAAFHEEGGSVDEVSAGRSRWQLRNVGSVAGIVFDSTRNAPLTGALVQLEGTDYTARTGPDGRFNLAGVSPGTYAIRFMHARLDSLPPADPAPVEVRVREAGTAAAQLAIPSPSTLARAACPASDTSRGVVFGTIRREAHSEPIPGATVRLRHDSISIRNGNLVFNPMRYTTTSDSAGRYHFCQVPARIRVQIDASAEGINGVVHELVTRPLMHHSDLVLRRQPSGPGSENDSGSMQLRSQGAASKIRRAASISDRISS